MGQLAIGLAAFMLILAVPTRAQDARTSPPPIKLLPPVPYPPLGPAGVSSPGCTVSEVGQIELRPIPGRPPNVFYCVLSVKVNGGTTWDLLTGTFDCDVPLFVRNADVVPLNTNVADEFAGSVSNDLKVFVYDAGAQAMFCTRPNVLVPFGPPAPISGVPSGAIDPKLCYDGVTEKLAYKNVLTGDILWANFNRTNGNTSGATVLVTGRGAAVGFHSPEPLRDPSGSARAFLLGKLDPVNLSDAWYASGKFDLPPDVAHPLHETAPPQATYLRNGTALGGTAFVPEGPVYGNPLKIDFVATNCEVTQGGGTAVLCNFFPYKPGGVFDVAVALGILGQPLPIPGVRGLLGLDPTHPIVFLPFRPANPYKGVECWNVPVPHNVPPGEFASQAILFSHTQATLFLGNASTVKIL